MAFHHHHPHHQSTPTPTTYYCHPPPQQPPPPPCYCHPPPPQQPPPCYCHPPPQQPQPQPQHLTTDPLTLSTIISHHHQQSHHQLELFSSLLKRIDTLETSFHKYTPTPTPISLRHAAALTIQLHFRSHLVRRSITLRHLKLLASAKSSLNLLKSSFSQHHSVDHLSRKATHLLNHLDSIQSADPMIRESKRSISRDILRFLEMVNGVCVKPSRKSDYGRVKCVKSTSDRKVIAANLSRRIGRMSKALEEIESLEDEDDIDRITENLRLQNLDKNGKKRVCFVEDGNVVRVYDVDGEIKSAFRGVDEIHDSSSGRQDEESDGERSSYSSKDGNNRMDDHEDRNYDRNVEFTFSAPQPVTMEARANLVTRKPGVKIVE